MIHNKNCLEVLQTLDTASIDACITDPPYLYLDHKLDAAFDEQKLFSELYRVLKKKSFLVFFGRGVPLMRWCLLCHSLGFEFCEEIVWDKIRNTSSMLSLARTHELIMVFRKGKKPINRVHINKIDYDLLINPAQIADDLKRVVIAIEKCKTFEDLEKLKTFDVFDRKTNMKHNITMRAGSKGRDRNINVMHAHLVGKLCSSILRINKEHYQFDHPTQKPVELMELLIRLVSTENDLIFDPFMGGGSAGIAAFNTDRRFVGCEIDADYFNIAEKRLGELTKQKTLETN